VIEDGVVTDCFIGVVDEVNNGLYLTYNLHEQSYPLLVTRLVERDVMLKQLRVTRGILSLLSRTYYRTEIKEALRTGWSSRLNCLSSFDLNTIDFTNLGKAYNGRDILKVIAFQIGQGLGLLDGVELYTKSAVSEHYPLLSDYLYRKSVSQVDLQNMLVTYLGRLRCINYIDGCDNTVYFIDYNKCFEMKHEKSISLSTFKI
jgi:hypothetical protein